MANVTGIISKQKFVAANGDVVTADLRDSFASHYLGTADAVPTTASVTIGGTAVTAKSQDWVNVGTSAYIYNGSTWTQFSEEPAIQAITVGGAAGNVTVSNKTADITAVPADIIGTTGHMTLNDGVLATTPTALSADGAVATKKYVDDAVQDITSAMVFKGGVTAATASSTTTLTLGDATLADINEGYTFKFTANETGGTTFKIGDILIANEDITHTAGATITYDSSKWTLVPSGDDVDVTSVGVETTTGLLTDQTSSGPITSTGTISLNLGNTTGVVAEDTSTAKIEVGVDSTYKLSANIGKMQATDLSAATPSTDGMAISPSVLKTALDAKQDDLTFATNSDLQFSTGSTTELDHADKLSAAVATSGVYRTTYNVTGHATGVTAAATASITEVDDSTAVARTVDAAAPTSSLPSGSTGVTYYDYDSTSETLTLYQLGYSATAIGTNTVTDVVRNADAS